VEEGEGVRRGKGGVFMLSTFPCKLVIRMDLYICPLLDTEEMSTFDAKQHHFNSSGLVSLSI
jgi:hypothetical protein